MKLVEERDLVVGRIYATGGGNILRYVGKGADTIDFKGVGIEHNLLDFRGIIPFPISCKVSFYEVPLEVLKELGLENKGPKNKRLV